MNRLGDTSAFVIPAGQLLLTRRGKTRMYAPLIKESKITRGHNYKLVKKQSRLDVRKYSFSQRTINVLSNLSTDCVHASSVNMFKNKIDKYLVKAGYT